MKLSPRGTQFPDRGGGGLLVCRRKVCWRGVMILSSGTPGTINTWPEAWGGGSCWLGGLGGRGHEGELMLLIRITRGPGEAGVKLNYYTGTPESARESAFVGPITQNPNPEATFCAAGGPQAFHCSHPAPYVNSSAFTTTCSSIPFFYTTFLFRCLQFLFSATISAVWTLPVLHWKNYRYINSKTLFQVELI